jgi:hypothetical protein
MATANLMSIVPSAPKTNNKKRMKKPSEIDVLSYQHTTSNKISRLLGKHNITTIHIPMKKTTSNLRLLKDNFGRKTPGVYCIPCECRKVYVGQTRRSIEIRCKEHMRHFCLGQPERSAVAEHIIHAGHSIT